MPTAVLNSASHHLRQPTSDADMNQSRTADWLHDELLRTDGAQVLVLDCRLQTDYAGGHVRGAINVTLPSLLLRRLANGKVSIASLIKCNESREKFLRHWKCETIVLCGGGDEGDMLLLDAQSGTGGSPSGATLPTLYRKLEQDGCHVVYLQGGYLEFESKYGEWCAQSDRCGGNGGGLDSEGGPIIGLQNLRISPTSAGPPAYPPVGYPSSSESGSSAEGDSLHQHLLQQTPTSGEDGIGGGGESGVGGDGDSRVTPPFEDARTPFPVEILPNLYLGNARNSADLAALERHRIRYILNVTSDLPNIFKADHPHIRYLQIPINDHWSQNLASFFPEAIAFIDEARQKQLGVLVHCLAGISRSVTITVAYLMHKFNMPLNDAYEFVKQRKANISPNISFMGQLLDFERELHLSPASRLPHCSCPLPCTCPPELRCTCAAASTNSGTTPDSGIDIGNWA